MKTEKRKRKKKVKHPVFQPTFQSKCQNKRGWKVSETDRQTFSKKQSIPQNFEQKHSQNVIQMYRKHGKNNFLTQLKSDQ